MASSCSPKTLLTTIDSVSSVSLPIVRQAPRTVIGIAGSLYYAYAESRESIDFAIGRPARLRHRLARRFGNRLAGFLDINV